MAVLQSEAMPPQVLRQHLAACGQHHHADSQTHQYAHQGLSPLSLGSSGLQLHGVFHVFHAKPGLVCLIAASSDLDHPPDRPRC